MENKPMTGLKAEMHDRLIAAEALVRGASVVGKDPVLAESPAITTIW